jgi:hypothetical protein
MRSINEMDNLKFTSNNVTWFCHRLQRLSDRLLSEMEAFYARFYQRSLLTRDSLTHRLHALIDAALSVAEQTFGLQPVGDRLSRRHHIEQAAWDWIYREDLPSHKTLSPLARGIANRIATDARLNLWHMQWVESFLTVSEQYVLEKPVIERIADMVLLLWDFVTCVKGGNPTQRPQLGPRRAQITIGEPISVSEHWDAYRGNRPAAVTELTQTLQFAMEQMIAQPPCPAPIKVPSVSYSHPLLDTAEYFN